MNIEQLQFNPYTIKKDNTRYDKLFNDYKAKQKMLNILQQRYLYKEGEKYTFCPIINNYIIKYKGLYCPDSTNRDNSYGNSCINHQNYNDMNNFNVYFDMKFLNSISPDLKDKKISYSTKNDSNIYGILKTLQNKNMYLSSIDNKSKNKIFKKKEINLSNSNKSKKKSQRYQNNSNCLKDDFRTNSYDELNSENECQRGRNHYSNFSGQYKMIKEGNSIKTLFSNKSHLSNKNNYLKCENKKTNTNRIRKKDKNRDKNNIPAKMRREKSNDSKRNLSNISSISDEKHLLNENNINIMNISNLNSNDIYSKNKYKRNRNVNENYYNYDNYSNQTNIDKTVSLKYLIQNEKSKNNSKPKKHSNINDKKANKLIDSIFNNKNINIYNAKANNSLMIKTNDIININLNENLKNMRIKSENYTSKIQDFPILINNNQKKNNYINVNNNMDFNFTENKKNINNNLNENISLMKENENNLRNYLSLNKGKNEKLKIKEFSQENKKQNYNKIIDNNLKQNEIKKVNNKIKINDYLSDSNFDENKNDKENIQISTMFSKNEINKSKKLQQSNRILKNRKNNPKLFSLDNNKNDSSSYQNTKMTNKRNNLIDFTKNNKIIAISEDKTKLNEEEKMIFSLKKKEKKYDGIYIKKNNNAKNNINNNNNFNQIEPFKENKNENIIENKIRYKISSHYNKEWDYNDQNKVNEEEDRDLSFQSLSDSKVLEIANIYVDEHVDKGHINGILTYKKKQNHIPYYDN